MKIAPPLLLATLLLSGCVAIVAGGAGAGAVAYIKGEYRVVYNHPYETVWSATEAALQDLRIAVYNSSKDSGLLEGTRRDGANVRIKLQADGAERTTAITRVGKLGDEDYSREIDRQIRSNINK